MKKSVQNRFCNNRRKNTTYISELLLFIDEYEFSFDRKLLLLLQGFMRNWENVTFQSDDYIKNEFKKGFDYIWRRLVPRIQDTGS